MWTPSQVAKMMADERVAAFRRKYPETAERMEVMRIVYDAMKAAHTRYVELFARMQREFEIGLIGPTGQSHKTNREAWLAAEVKNAYLRELYAESPLSEDCGRCINKRGDEL
jgi:hypothetical protein